MGWVPPMGSHSDALTHTANGQLLFCAQRRENPAIASDQTGTGGENPETGSRSGTQAEEDGKDSLKDEVHSLLPRAFSRFSQTMMWIDTVNGLIMLTAPARKSGRYFGATA